MVNTVYNPQNYDVFIGIDVDSKSYAFTEMDHEFMITSKKIPSKPTMLVKYIKTHFPHNRVLCAYEAGGTGFELYDTLLSNNIPCCIVSPNAIPKATNAMVKNNRIDSQHIAQAIKSKAVNPIRVPFAEYRELRHLIRIYDNYSKNQTIAKNRIKGLLLFESLYQHFFDDCDRRWTIRFINEIKHCPCSPATRLRLDALLSDLTYARSQLAMSLKNIKTFCASNNNIRSYIDCLISIPGIGIRTASYILGKLGAPELLRSPREIGAFFGLTPKENSTGTKVQKGSISHNGNALARSLLVEAAWVAIRYDKELRYFYQRIKGRNPKSIAAQKAITAVARKLTARIYSVLKNKKKYIVVK